VFAVAFGLFFIGLAVVGQGFIRTEPPNEITPAGTYSMTRTVPPPEKHPVRLVLIGLAMIGVAVAVVAVSA
jgi:hypothetical protein